MSRGLQAAGWALEHGQTFCPSCARMRGLTVAQDELDSQESSAAAAQAPGEVQALEPFAISAPLREPRGRRASRLLRASFSVLRQDPELLVFPAVAMTLTLLLAAYPITFVSLYCGVALAAVLAGRLEGRPMTAGDGWKAARERIGIIAAWTLMVCTVGAALRLIERYVPLGAKIIVAIVDLSWTLATMFAVPVLAYENLGSVDVLRRSSRIFRQRWGTQVGGIVGIGVASVFIYIPFVVLLIAGVGTAGATGVLLTVLGGGGLFAAIAAQTAMDQVFRVFVYRSAVGLDTSAGPFADSDLQAPFARKRGLFS
jgi:hypothetical protein